MILFTDALSTTMIPSAINTQRLNMHLLSAIAAAVDSHCTSARSAGQKPLLLSLFCVRNRVEKIDRRRFNGIRYCGGRIEVSLSRGRTVNFPIRRNETVGRHRSQVGAEFPTYISSRNAWPCNGNSSSNELTPFLCPCLVRRTSKAPSFKYNPSEKSFLCFRILCLYI